MSVTSDKDRIILVGRNPKMLSLLPVLEKKGYDPLLARDVGEGLKLVERKRPAAVVVGVGLSGDTILAFCRELRTQGSLALIIVLLEPEALIDPVVCQEAGADQVLPLPLGLVEVALIVANIRRRTEYSRPIVKSAPLKLGPIWLDSERHEVRLGDQPVHLPPIEFQILSVLMKKGGRLISKEDLYRAVWGKDLPPTTRKVSVHISRIRGRLHQAELPKNTILTESQGYRMNV